ncbi:MAG: hypothetical protein COZ46_08390 [Verrucomicrobia bacterium CG_4_10_14_3_um_filter_43_23]|nr:MAG: hypothetical protein AUJ82_04905 [Verrucomicrobia bacterium CG1_02_43_26]PIX57567.1 MAG: hypothetical protein COZ46_08390 [Verrucomicrobia bacterium CG_4_10_14_3_um_filter_43_23]PIY61005.1 MAG: hypothetical protein COY94_07590 [Verrucomicrobia bacterium CG_4_10_14_0_8_um_filter_43_34]PJA43394.1 MAG: hypothetical protein CO175_08305 [Verrucomicrobia bacterium CG_4_9_14_3_um_filter_43_20]
MDKRLINNSSKSSSLDLNNKDTGDGSNVRSVIKDKDSLNKNQVVELVDSITIDQRNITQISSGVGFDSTTGTLCVDEDKLTLKEDMGLTVQLLARQCPHLLMANSILSDEMIKETDDISSERCNALKRLHETGLIIKDQNNYILMFFSENEFFDQISGPTTPSKEVYTQIKTVFTEGSKRFSEVKDLVEFLIKSVHKEVNELPVINYTKNANRAEELITGIENQESSGLTIIDQTQKDTYNSFKTREQENLERKQRIKLKAIAIEKFRQQKKETNKKTLALLDSLFKCFDVSADILKRVRSCPVMAYALYDMLNLQWNRFIIETAMLKKTEFFKPDVVDNLYYHGALAFALVMSKLRPFAEEIAQECKFELNDKCYSNFMKHNGELLKAIEVKRAKLSKSKLKKNKVVQLKTEKQVPIIKKTEIEEGATIGKKPELKDVKVEIAEEMKTKEMSLPKEVTVKKPTKKERKIKKMLEKSQERKELVEQYKTEQELAKEKKINERIALIKNAYKLPDATSFAKISNEVNKTHKEIFDIVFGFKENNKVINHEKVISLARHLNLVLSKYGFSTCGAELVAEVKNRIHIRHDSKDSGDKLPKHYVEVLRSSFILFGIIPNNWEPQTQEDFDALEKFKTRQFYWKLINPEE